MFGNLGKSNNSLASGVPDTNVSEIDSGNGSANPSSSHLNIHDHSQLVTGGTRGSPLETTPRAPHLGTGTGTSNSTSSVVSSKEARSGGDGPEAPNRNVKFLMAGGGGSSSGGSSSSGRGGGGGSGSERDGALPQQQKTNSSPRPQPLFTIGESTVESTTPSGIIPSLLSTSCSCCY